MSGFSYADPVDFDMSAASGSTTFDVPNPAGPPPWAYHDSANTSTTYFPAAAALDGDTNTCWETNGLDPGNTWYAIGAGDGSDVTLTSYQLRPRNGWAGRAPSEWTLESSNDGSSWTTADTQTGVTDWGGSGEEKSFTPASSVTAKYFRLNVTATNGDSIINLGEFYLNGTPNPVSGGPIYFYVRVGALQQNRVHHPVVTPGTTGLVDEYNSWLAWVEAYPENTGATVGSFNRYSPPDSYISGFGSFHGKGIIVRFHLTGYGSFTWAWTSTDYDETRPDSWFCPQPLDPAGGTVAYDGVYESPLQSRRYYTLTPTTDDVITLTQDEPWSYMEVYREDNLSPFDDFIEDGYNDGSGNIYPNGGDCAFTPTPGETYVVVVYPNGDPDQTTQYHLTWSTTTLTPPPYVVANDAYTAPITIPIVGTSGTFTYDNTGATEDDSTHTGKRSIWYLITIPTDIYVSLVATPGVADTGTMPKFAIWNVDGSYNNVDLHQGYNMPPGHFAFKAQAGVTYLLQLYFDASVPTTPWDAAGSLAWSLVDVPNDSSQTARALSVGAEQTVPTTHPIAGYTNGSQWYSITTPVDGGFNAVLEKPTGSTGSLTGQVYVPVPVTTSNPTGLLYVGDLPSREAGTTDTAALMHGSKAGQVFILRVTSTVPSSTLRWGVATAVTWDTWHPTDWGKHVSNPGVETVKVWPVSLAHQNGGSGSVSWGASDLVTTADTGSASAEEIGNLEGPVSSGANATGPTEGSGAESGVHWGGSVVRNLGHGDKTTRLEFSNTIQGIKVGIMGNTNPSLLPSVLASRQNPYDPVNIEPILDAASFRWRALHGYSPDPRLEQNAIGDWIPSWVSPAGVGTWLQNNIASFAIEWSADNPTNTPRFDVFRAAQAHWNASVSGVGIFATSYQPSAGMQSQLTLRTNDIPAIGGSNPPAFLGPFVGGVVIDSFSQGSDGSGGGVYQPKGDVYSNTFLGLRDDCLIASDVTLGQWPDTDWSMAEVYGCQTFLPEEIEYSDMWERLGSAEGPGGWPFFGYDCNWRVQLQIGRRMPAQYRVGKYTEDLGDLTPPPVPLTPAGAILTPTQDIHGDPGGAEVHFATT